MASRTILVRLEQRVVFGFLFNVLISTSMTTNQNQRHACRRTDIVKMFFSIANALRTSGRDFFLQTTELGITYSFRIGSNLITYSVQKGGQA